jgi:hypothetical protein
MTGNDKTIRVGLIGYGFAGKTFHAPLIQSVPGLALNVIGSGKREIVEAKYPGVLVCSAGEVPTHLDSVGINTRKLPREAIEEIKRLHDERVSSKTHAQ